MYTHIMTKLGDYSATRARLKFGLGVCKRLTRKETCDAVVNSNRQRQDDFDQRLAIISRWCCILAQSEAVVGE